MLRLLCPLCVVTYVFMRGPTEVFDFPENGPSVITKPQWIDREKVVEVIHDTKLTKEQRIEKIKGMPIHESEANTKIWLSHLPTVIDFFDWAGQEKAKASPKAKEVIAKGEKMFGVDFMMQDEKEQSRTLLRFVSYETVITDLNIRPLFHVSFLQNPMPFQFADIEDVVEDKVRDEIITLAEKFTERLEQLGFEKAMAIKDTLN
ncbi:hypothetical protein ANCCEY_05890 [Ancylostoma ceylanicum]|uniref:Uncharacterized protein n=1 Tax=Ancylostoma ceylanicum TaxID=53326 RepID=A0A0D6LY41_9BILA|nr:hypothetical protein ANCCEY_05890 [Ancylostoma ceylanicum]